MSWIVTQDYIKGRLTYLVENTETGDAHVVRHFKGYSERSASLRKEA